MYLNRWEILTSKHSAGGRQCITASPNLKRPLSSRLRQRGSPETSKIREPDRGQIVFVFIVEGIVALKLAFSATLDTFPRPLFRAHYNSLLRLKDAYTLVGNFLEILMARAGKFSFWGGNTSQKSFGQYSQVEM